jgi:hypothetical protein
MKKTQLVNPINLRPVEIRIAEMNDGIAGRTRDSTPHSMTVYIDPTVPREMYPTLVCHEYCELVRMMNGNKWETAHQGANETEKRWVEKYGANWDAYNRNYLKLLRDVEARGRAVQDPYDMFRGEQGERIPLLRETQAKGIDVGDIVPDAGRAAPRRRITETTSIDTKLSPSIRKEDYTVDRRGVCHRKKDGAPMVCPGKEQPSGPQKGPGGRYIPRTHTNYTTDKPTPGEYEKPGTNRGARQRSPGVVQPSTPSPQPNSEWASGFQRQGADPSKNSFIRPDNSTVKYNVAVVNGKKVKTVGSLPLPEKFAAGNRKDLTPGQWKKPRWAPDFLGPDVYREDDIPKGGGLGNLSPAYTARSGHRNLLSKLVGKEVDIEFTIQKVGGGAQEDPEHVKTMSVENVRIAGTNLEVQHMWVTGITPGEGKYKAGSVIRTTARVGEYHKKDREMDYIIGNFDNVQMVEEGKPGWKSEYDIRDPDTGKIRNPGWTVREGKLNRAEDQDTPDKPWTKTELKEVPIDSTQKPYREDSTRTQSPSTPARSTDYASQQQRANETAAQRSKREQLEALRRRLAEREAAQGKKSVEKMTRDKNGRCHDDMGHLIPCGGSSDTPSHGKHPKGDGNSGTPRSQREKDPQKFNPDPVPVYKPTRDVDAATRWASKYLIYKPTGEEAEGKEPFVDFGPLKPEIVNQVVDRIADNRRHGVPPFSQIVYIEEDSSMIAGVGFQNNLLLNATFLNDKKALAETQGMAKSCHSQRTAHILQVIEDRKQQRPLNENERKAYEQIKTQMKYRVSGEGEDLPPEKLIQASVDHELAHYMYQVPKVGQNAEQHQQMVNEIDKIINLTKNSNYKYLLSSYAGENPIPEETWAEIYAAYRLGEKQYLHPEVIKFFKKWFKGM